MCRILYIVHLYLTYICTGLKNILLRNIVFTISLLCIIGSISCSKKNNTNVLGPYSMASVFSNMAVTPLTVTLNASSGGTFYGNSGTRYYFSPWSFERDSIAIVGDVQIQVAEYLKKSDLIFSGILPYSNGLPFVSGGAYYLNVMQGGQQVVIARPAKYQVYIPQQNTPPVGLGLFFGRPDDTVISNSINWQVADTAHGGITYLGDTVVINSDSTHFGCAGIAVGSVAHQNISLSVSAPITTFSDTIMAYAVYDSVNIVWQMQHVQNHVVTDSVILSLPLHFVVFTIINGDFYSGILAATPASGSNYSIYLTKSSPAQLRSKIDAL